MNFIKKTFKKICLVISIIFVFGFTENYFEISKNLDVFTTIYKELNIFYVDDTDAGKLMKTGIDAMLKSLDPYTTYYPESEVEDLKFTTTGQYGGIGAIITKRDNYVYISEPYENYPAHKSGLLAGDKILKIDGKSAKNKSTEEISKILKGQPKTSVELLVERKVGLSESPESKERFSVVLEREKVSIKSVPYFSYLNEDVGYVKLRSFTRNCSSDLKKAIDQLKNQADLKGLVLDLRNNPGGLLDESVKIVNLFVDKGEEVVSTKGKIKSWHKSYKANNEPVFRDLPLVVLINSASASASEIVSGAIQDLDRGVVIGQKSYGKGLVQQTRELSYNAKLKLTVAKYYIPSGRCIQTLDYSNRNDDGSVGNVPDSLITVFKTRNGRKVYDGGGITPDIVVEKEKYHNLIFSLINQRHFFDYATNFKIKNKNKIQDTFIVQDDEFDLFVNYLSDKEYSYKTKTEEALEELKNHAEKEGYFSILSETHQTFSEQLKQNKKDDVYKNKDKIKEILSEEILSRYYYQKGRIKASLAFDKDIEKAISIINNNNKYREILNINN